MRKRLYARMDLHTIKGIALCINAMKLELVEVWKICRNHKEARKRIRNAGKSLRLLQKKLEEVVKLGEEGRN